MRRGDRVACCFGLPNEKESDDVMEDELPEISRRGLQRRNQMLTTTADRYEGLGATLQNQEWDKLSSLLHNLIIIIKKLGLVLSHQYKENADNSHLTTHRILLAKIPFVYISYKPILQIFRRKKQRPLLKAPKHR